MGAFKEDWTKMGEWLNAMPIQFRVALRRMAEKNLIDDGFEEIGSSDIGSELFGMYQDYIHNNYNNVGTFIIDMD